MGFWDRVKRTIGSGVRWINNKIINPTMSTVTKMARGARKFINRTLPSWVQSGKEWLQHHGLGGVSRFGESIWNNTPLRKGYELVRDGINAGADFVDSVDKTVGNIQNQLGLEQNRESSFIPSKVEQELGLS